MLSTKDNATETGPLVSVVTAVLNREETIREAIESVLNQTYGNIEYIIIDGKSTDSSLEIANSYAEAFKRKGINYVITSEKDRNLFDAYNKGIALAKGELVGIINSDDWYETDAVEKAVKQYKRVKFDLLFADLRIYGRSGSYLKRAKMTRLVSSRYWNHPTSFIKKAVYNRKLYAIDNPYADFKLYVEMRRENCKIVVLNEVLANFRRGGMSGTSSFRHMRKNVKLRYDIYRENGYSRLYIIECLGIEIVKYILTRKYY